ncbi:hypothetical protein E2C01_008673 [Portunus trituberculatus]|uniref:Uncharacterized protein n=1 Tax=Portunus trituberculatus TaxID=210409 RepID=A0A5B7D2K8_PORTR|nr:hypothetical protein [Portunus trituberculatus]
MFTTCTSTGWRWAPQGGASPGCRRGCTGVRNNTGQRANYTPTTLALCWKQATKCTNNAKQQKKKLTTEIRNIPFLKGVLQYTLFVDAFQQGLPNTHYSML